VQADSYGTTLHRGPPRSVEAGSDGERLYRLAAKNFLAKLIKFFP
jgi:hypothetical protein